MRNKPNWIRVASINNSQAKSDIGMNIKWAKLDMSNMNKWQTS